MELKIKPIVDCEDIKYEYEQQLEDNKYVYIDCNDELMQFMNKIGLVDGLDYNTN